MTKPSKPIPRIGKQQVCPTCKGATVDKDGNPCARCKGRGHVWTRVDRQG